MAKSIKIRRSVIEQEDSKVPESEQLKQIKHKERLTMSPEPKKSSVEELYPSPIIFTVSPEPKKKGLSSKAGFLINVKPTVLFSASPERENEEVKEDRD